MKVKMVSDSEVLINRASYYGVKPDDVLDVNTISPTTQAVTVSKNRGYKFMLMAGEYEVVEA